MNSSLIEQVRDCADMGLPIFIEKNLGIINCPKMKDLSYGLLVYLSSINMFIDFFDEHKENFINDLIISNNINDFIEFTMIFYDCDKAGYNNQTFDIKYFKTIENKDVVVACLNKDNISLFFDILKILHHRAENEYLDECETDSRIVKEFKKRIKEEKKKIAKIKSENNNTGLTLHDVLSALSARHPSINSLNIKELSYYQLIDQFSMINKIDSWKVNMQALVNGNIEKDKQNNIKHYTERTDD